MGSQTDRTAPASDRQVLVVGGGVEALTTAAFLHHEGLSPVLVTPPAAPRVPDGRVVLWSSALALLGDLDVTEDLHSVAPAVRHWDLRGVDGGDERLTSAHTDRWPFVVVGRATLRELLRDQLPDGSVRLSKTPRALTAADSGVAVEFDDGVVEHFDVVVGADGARSWLRGVTPELAAPTPWGTTTWTVRVAEGTGDAAGITELWTDDGVLTWGPRDGDPRLQFVTTAADAGDAEAALRRVSASFDSLSNGRPRTDLTVLGRRVDHVVRTDRWTADRTALVGRAARCVPPVLSVGPSLAIEDGYVLAAELSTAASPTTALRSYANRRRERHRTLARHVPLDDRFPTGRGDGTERAAACRSLHVALLRSFFADRVPAMSASVRRHV